MIFHGSVEDHFVVTVGNHQMENIGLEVLRLCCYCQLFHYIVIFLHIDSIASNFRNNNLLEF